MLIKLIGTSVSHDCNLSAAEARKSVKESTDYANLEGKYIELVRMSLSLLSPLNSAYLGTDTDWNDRLTNWTMEFWAIVQFQELRRQERVHVQERGKLLKDKVLFLLSSSSFWWDSPLQVILFASLAHLARAKAVCGPEDF